ncbi:MAG: NAD(+)/NADH kinase, partial [Niameybacter sp.]
MKRIGIVPNLLKDKDLETTKRVVTWLLNNEIEVYIAYHIGSLLDESLHLVEEEVIYKECEAIIAIGGDGTILSVAQKACLYDLPIMGINLGRLGFLADVETSEVQELLPKLIQNQYIIDERMMLMVKVIEPSGEAHKFQALNDIYVARGSSSRISEFEIKVNDQFLDIYPADGIIFATPTGSTAYNLSAGGPIVSPSTHQIMITPICPHSIYSRAVIVADTDHIDIK